MQLAHDRGELPWDSVPAPEFDFGELDMEVLERYRRMLETSLDAHQLLLARRLAQQTDGKLVLNDFGNGEVGVGAAAF